MACTGEAEPPQQLVYLAIGASDAAGVGAQPVTDGYVYVIAEELEKRIDEVFPTLLAIPGADAEELDAGLDRLLESEIEPDLVTIWTGANDVIRAEDVDDFGAALEHMLERLRERTDGVIVAANIPDLTKLPRFREHPDADVTRERIEAFNDTIVEQATAHDVARGRSLRGARRGRPRERGRISSQRRGAPPHRGGVPRGHFARARPRARGLSPEAARATALRANGQVVPARARWSTRCARGAAIAAPGNALRYSTTATGCVGGVRLPQKRLSSTFSGVIAAPGILRLGPQSSTVSSDFSPTTS